MALEELTSGDKLKLGDKSLHVYRMLAQHIGPDNWGISLASRKDATCFLRWIMSLIPDTTIQACYRSATGGRALERRVSSVIFNVYQSIGIEKDDDSRQSLENHGKIDEIRRLSNKKFDESHGVHCNLALTDDYLRPTKHGEYQYLSGVIGISYNPFLERPAYILSSRNC